MNQSCIAMPAKIDHRAENMYVHDGATIDSDILKHVAFVILFSSINETNRDKGMIGLRYKLYHQQIQSIIISSFLPIYDIQK